RHAPARWPRRTGRRRRADVRRRSGPALPRCRLVECTELARPREYRPALLLRGCARGSRGHFRTPPLMRVLLIAYEFPPSPSPQSLRWAYLSRELVALGHYV